MSRARPPPKRREGGGHLLAAARPRKVNSRSRLVTSDRLLCRVHTGLATLCERRFTSENGTPAPAARC